MIIIGQVLNVDINQLRTKARTNYTLSLLYGIHTCTCTVHVVKGKSTYTFE